MFSISTNFFCYRNENSKFDINFKVEIILEFWSLIVWKYRAEKGTYLKENRVLLGTYDKFWEIVLHFTREMQIISKCFSIEILWHYFSFYIIFYFLKSRVWSSGKHIKFGPEIPKFYSWPWDLLMVWLRASY